MIDRIRIPVIAVAIVMLLAAGAVVQAQTFPTKQVTIVSPWEPGGLNDILSRAIAVQSNKFLGQAVIVENIPGGGGVVGTKNVERAKPDGYTLVAASNSTIFTQYLMKSPNDMNNLAPVIQVCSTPPVLVVKADAPWKDFREFKAFAEKNPRKIRVANSGTGGSSHLYTQLMEVKTGIKVTHIPYQGFAPSMASILGGHVEATIVTPNVAVQYVNAGQIKVLGVASEKKFYLFPNAPTFKEQGVDFVIEHWVGLMTAAKTPQASITVLADAFEKGMNQPEFKTLMEKNGLELINRKGEDFGKFVREDDRMWKDLIRSTIKK